MSASLRQIVRQALLLEAKTITPVTPDLRDAMLLYMAKLMPEAYRSSPDAERVIEFYPGPPVLKGEMSQETREGFDQLVTMYGDPVRNRSAAIKKIAADFVKQNTELRPLRGWPVESFSVSRRTYDRRAFPDAVASKLYNAATGVSVKGEVTPARRENEQKIRDADGILGGSLLMALYKTCTGIRNAEISSYMESAVRHIVDLAQLLNEEGKGMDAESDETLAEGIFDDLTDLDEPAPGAASGEEIDVAKAGSQSVDAVEDEEEPLDELETPLSILSEIEEIVQDKGFSKDVTDKIEDIRQELLDARDSL